MLVVISPAKKMDMTPMDMTPMDITPGSMPEGLPLTMPQFADDAQALAKIAGALDVDGLMGLMGISENLAALNNDRFAAFGHQDRKAAILAFAGDTYQGLDAATLDEPELAWAQNHLRILSGLYGVLRPLDAIEPYRLEMGSRLKTDRGASLYAYWGARLAETLNQQANAMGAKALVNCASQEYFGAVDQTALALPVLTPVFKDRKDGKVRIVSFYAKKARGAMARFIIQHQVKTADALKAFNAGGYAFQPDQSDAATLVFTRDDPKAG